MRFASLGSGSEGNALLISSGQGPDAATIMVDCGFSLRETERRLARLGVTPGHLSALVLSHEHHDHVAGVAALASRYRLPVWLTRGTWHALPPGWRSPPRFPFHFCRNAEPFAVAGLHVEPYTVPHDAREPVQFVVSDARFRVGILTDAGCLTPHIVSSLGACDALFIECNHDVTMLANSSYPTRLKSRIGGTFGHLSNDSALDILRAVDRSRLKTVVAAHLSRENNTHEVVRSALENALGREGVVSLVASQDEGLHWINLA